MRYVLVVFLMFLLTGCASPATKPQGWQPVLVEMSGINATDGDITVYNPQWYEPKSQCAGLGAIWCAVSGYFGYDNQRRAIDALGRRPSVVEVPFPVDPLIVRPEIIETGGGDE